jgi:hypothetical protein
VIEQPTRRGLLIGLGSLIAAPAIVRASSLMPVKVIDEYRGPGFTQITGRGEQLTVKQLLHLKAMLEHETIQPIDGKYVFFAHPSQLRDALGYFDGSNVDVKLYEDLP